MTTQTSVAAPPPEQALSVTVSGIEIPCRYSPPAGAPRGSVLLLPGSLYSDVDGDYPTMNLRPHAYRDLAQQLAARGFAVLRMAKVGPGTGSRTLDADAARVHRLFETRVEVAAAGLVLLGRVSTARPMIVAGHSEGALVASLLAGSSAELDGVVSLSGPAEPLLTLLRMQIAQMVPPGVAFDMSVYDATVARIRAGEPLPVEAATNPQTAMLASMPEAAIAYLRSVDAVDPLSAIARVSHPVLIVQGGRDASVPVEHAARLRAARGELPTASASFPTLTHFYKQAPAGLPPMQSLALDTESDPAVAESIAAWVRSTFAGRSE